jgi:hypothetical protein
MLSIFIPWHKTPLIPPLKMTIKVIYSPGIKVYYAGVVFETLWYLLKQREQYRLPLFTLIFAFFINKLAFKTLNDTLNDQFL